MSLKVSAADGVKVMAHVVQKEEAQCIVLFKMDGDKFVCTTCCLEMSGRGNVFVHFHLSIMHAMCSCALLLFVGMKKMAWPRFSQTDL